MCLSMKASVQYLDRIITNTGTREMAEVGCVQCASCHGSATNDKVGVARGWQTRAPNYRGGIGARRGDARTSRAVLRISPMNCAPGVEVRALHAL